MTICERQVGGRILCIRLSGLGDVVHCLNALSLLREARPRAHIAWVVEDRFADLLRRHPHLDELITVPRSAWGRMLRNPAGWRTLAGEWRELAALLHRREFDITVDFQSSLKSAWIVMAAASPMRVGFAPPVNREWNFLVHNHLVRVPHSGLHRIERNLALLAPLGIPTRYAEPVVPACEADREAAEVVLSALTPGAPLVVIHPGTSAFAAFKRWPPERYAALADRLIARRGTEVVLTYGPGEEDLVRSVAAEMRHVARLFPPTGGIGALIQLLSSAALFIGSDTGPLHLASALGVPTVALFGPKDPVQTGPYCSRSIVVTGTAPCRPCTRRRCPDPLCMTSITVAQVEQAAIQLLDGCGTARARPGMLHLPATYPFRLEPWKGEVLTAYAEPEMFRALCDPQGPFEPIAGSGPPTNITSPCPSHPGEQWLGRRYPALDGSAKAALRCCVALAAAGQPVVLPVCRLRKGPAWLHGDVLVAPDPAGWQPLGSLRDLQRPDRRRLLTVRLAEMVRQLHRAGRLHRRLGPDAWLARTDCGEPTIAWNIARLHRSASLKAVLPLLREMLMGMDLGRLWAAWPGATDRDAVRFFRAYCRDFLGARLRRELVRASAVFWRRVLEKRRRR